jgi:hypothetical protein
MNIDNYLTILGGVAMNTYKEHNSSLIGSITKDKDLDQELDMLINSYHGGDNGVYYKNFLRNIDNNLSISNLLLSLEICRQLNEFTIYALSDTLYSLFKDNKALYEEIYHISGGIYKEIMDNNLLLKDFNYFKNSSEPQTIDGTANLSLFYQFHNCSYSIAI